MAPCYGWGLTASRLEQLWRGSLYFTKKFPEILGTHFINLRRMKDWVSLGATRLNMGPLNWESSTLLTTRPLLHEGLTWDMKCNRQNFLSLWAIFCPFTQKTNFEKINKMPGDITSVPKIMIVCYTVPEIWHVTDVIFNFHFGLFSAILIN